MVPHGARGSVVVEALRYKLEGTMLQARRSHVRLTMRSPILPIDLIHPTALWP
jgi:hypothetical protein